MLQKSNPIYAKQSFWIQGPWWLIRNLLKIASYVLVGAIAVAMIGFALYVNSLPDLSTWHTVQLENRFEAGSDIHTLEEYMTLEDQLFEELDRQIYAKLKANEKSMINRYTKNSYSDPSRWPVQWNRTTELPVKEPKAGILLLHGMSDSPYSLHAQASYLQANGVWVVNMRMPGHGTIPSGLIEIEWQDMAAAVQIGMKHLREKLGDKPLYIMGYSTGAPLALNYTIKALNDDTLPRPSGLIFYSPAIGVTPVASLAVWQGRIGHFLGIEKLAWNGIVPEYDPFKYGSFAVNAGDLVYRIGNEVQKQLNELEQDRKKQKSLPPMLSFASAVDATVVVADTVKNLYNRLPDNNSTLILFDVNHKYEKTHLIPSRVQTSIKALASDKRGNRYRLSIVSNNAENTKGNPQQITIDKSGAMQQESLEFDWPEGVYSLSHLALPIKADDPLYGRKGAPPSPGIKLGDITLHGEKGALEISASYLQRQRWNPFHTYTREKVLRFMGLE